MNKVEPGCVCRNGEIREIRCESLQIEASFKKLRGIYLGTMIEFKSTSFSARRTSPASLALSLCLYLCLSLYVLTESLKIYTKRRKKNLCLHRLNNEWKVRAPRCRQRIKVNKAGRSSKSHHIRADTDSIFIMKAHRELTAVISNRTL